MVASQHRRAAEAGAAVLEAGGDAIEAAVATSFARGVVEPWMSGVAAGGCMVLWRAKERKAHVVDYGMRAPRALDPADYPLVGEGKAMDLFAWPLVKDDRNVQGAAAVAVPGVVAGMALVHERFGRVPWRELVAPAAALAAEGMRADWYSGLLIASAARGLAADSDAAAMFLEEGRWPILGTWTALAEKRLDQRRLAATLEAIARDGPKALYGGDVGAAMAKDVRDKGGSLSLEDLSQYRAHFAEPLHIPYREGRIYAAPGMTGGPALAHALQILTGVNKPSYADYARALETAWTQRLRESGDREAPGAAPACTTHFSVVDRHGNLCAVTQTLLSIFGSRVVSPSTGVLLNNGIMWFDPEPGKPNSLAPDKRVLANYCPVLGIAADGRQFALGASGGRKILGAVMQLSSFILDHGMTLEQAFHQPRIDVSGGGQVVADQALGPEILDALAEVMPTVPGRRMAFPYLFACPARANLSLPATASPQGDNTSVQPMLRPVSRSTPAGHANR